MVSGYNPKRKTLSVQLLPSSLVAANTGNVFGKWGSAPKADFSSNSWDFVLNAGSTDGTNLDESQAQAPRKDSLWLTADTAGQIVNINEQNVEATPAI